MTRRTGVVLLLAAALLAIYLPDLGHGFLRDDFMWIRAGRIDGSADLVRIATDNTGFYRPVVAATFAADYAVFGLHPFAYAATNLLLLCACAALVHRVGAVLGLSPAAAIAAAALWAFNFHGVNMALLWISGRTALLLCLWSLLAFVASVRGGWYTAAAMTLLAMLSKEEAIVLPFTLAAWSWYSAGLTSSGLRRTLRASWPVLAAIAVYAALRWNSGAFGPLDAPSYYRFTWSIPLLLRNVVEYLHRGAMVAAIPVVLLLIGARRTPSLTPGDRRLLVFGVLWFVSGYAVTLLLPVRSDLYALTPSVGACVMAGAAIDAWRRDAARRTGWTLTVLVVLALLLIPVYRLRNRRWVAPADLSASVTGDLVAATADVAPRSAILLIDDPAAQPNLASVFANLLPDAIALYVGRDCTGEIVSRGDDRVTAGTLGRALRLADGHLRPER